MIRVLLACLLLPAFASAWEFPRSVLFDTVALLELRMPGDSVFVFDSMLIGQNAAWEECPVAKGHLAFVPGRAKSPTLQRWALAASAPVCGVCLGGEEECQPPSVVEDYLMTRSDPCWELSPPRDVVVGRWDVASALVSIRATMDSIGDWRLYRYGPVFDTGTTLAASGFTVLQDWFRKSPWNRRDTLFRKAQWLLPDSSLSGHEGVGSILILDGKGIWSTAESGWTDSLRTDGLRIAWEITNSCTPGWGSGLQIRTSRGSFAISKDTILVDTLISTRDFNFQELRSVQRARIALSDLDSLLHNMPVGIAGAATKPVPVRISNGAAFLDAGTDQGRLELIGARGQILSKVSGRGRLRLPLTGKGVRWVRWKRGAEQGAVPVLF